MVPVSKALFVKEVEEEATELVKDEENNHSLDAEVKDEKEVIAKYEGVKEQEK